MLAPGSPRRSALVVGLALTFIAGTALAPATSAARPVKRASFDLARGTAAGLVLGRSTRAAAVKRFGAPRRSYPDGGSGDWQRYYEWGCGRGCNFVVGIHRESRKVVTVWVTSRRKRGRIRTAAGTYLGIGERAAEIRDRGRFRESCIRHFAKTKGGLTLEIGASSGRVTSLQMRTREGGVLC